MIIAEFDSHTKNEIWQSHRGQEEEWIFWFEALAPVPSVMR